MNDFGSLRWLAKKTRVPITASENLATRRQIQRLLHSESVGYVHIDLGYTVGISESWKIATLAETKHIPIVFHGCTGPLGSAVDIALCVPSAKRIHTGDAALRCNPAFGSGMTLPNAEQKADRGRSTRPYDPRAALLLERVEHRSLDVVFRTCLRGDVVHGDAHAVVPDRQPRVPQVVHERIAT